MRKMTLFLAVVVLVGACSDAAPNSTIPSPVATSIGLPPSSAATTPAPTTTESPDATVGSNPPAGMTEPVLLDRVPLIDLLALIPDNDPSRERVWIQDHDLTRRIEGVGEYDPTTQHTHEWVRSWYSAPDAGSFFMGRGYPADEHVEAYLREFGVWFADVDQEVHYGSFPHFAMLFTFDDPPGVDQAVRTDPLWSDSLEVTAVPPVTEYSWGSRAGSLELATAARPRGEAGRLTVIEGMAPGTGAVDDLLVRTLYAEAAEMALDPIVGSGSSLADDETYQALAEVLDAEGASSVLLTAALPLASRQAHRFEGDLEDFFNANPLLGDYQALGLGSVPRDGGWTAVMVLAHATQQSANDNARRLARQLESGTAFNLGTYADLLTLDTIDTSGTVVVARFAPNERSPWKTLYRLLQTNEPLFWIDDIRPKPQTA